ncbi:histidine phosphatase family protein [Ideonella azotifigens]|uniref:Histidine phosphatase family protein n=1 Tax=Ideonella azotifigens TaxID=513160 RepID=A0ABP3VK65_9BURK|nr:histidine phosphatase family protein [Ideonella azotifigens]MCD2342915.1 histidine phosphatase family protein [Ideonella azotifigens]
MPTALPDPLPAFTPPARRRLYLMRHSSVDYFLPDGSPLDPHSVPLSATGRAQADAAGRLFGEAGVRFDRVLVSGLPRTRETAQRVLAAAGQSITPVVDTRLQEIRPGRLENIPRDELHAAFTELFNNDPQIEQHRFLGGETVGELLDRILPAFDELLADSGWQTVLLVLHGAVNRGLLSRALCGQRTFFGRLEQAPGCINVLDIGTQDIVVRTINLAPTQWLQERERLTTMEKLLLQYTGKPV